MNIFSYIFLISLSFQLSLNQIIIPTCCSHQNGFNHETGECSTESTSSKFDEMLNLPTFLLTEPYRNRTHAQNLQFRLKPLILKCDGEQVSITLDIEDQPFANLVAFTPDGTLQIETDYFSTKEYCVDEVRNNRITFILCKPICNSLRPCIPKCCEIGQVWEFTEDHSPFCGDLEKGEAEWSPTLYSDRYNKLERDERAKIIPHFQLHHPASGYCEYGHPFLFSHRHFEQGVNGILFRILQDGTIVAKFRKQWVPLPKGDVCIDGVKYPFGGADSTSSTDVKTVDDESSQTLLFYCHKDVETSEGWISKVYGIAMIISSLFLICTLTVFILLWEKYRGNIQRWTIFYYVISLLFMYLFFTLSYFSHYFDGEFATNMPLCKFIAVGIHFFFLSSFAFLFCINFEVWFTLRSLVANGIGRISLLQGMHRAFAYLGFGLGLPSLLVIVGLTLDSVYENDDETEVIIPEYGRNTCNLGSREAFWAYMYGPISGLLASNLFFLLFSMNYLWRIFKTAKQDSNLTVKHQTQSDLLSSFGKLYIIQGGPWIFELVSFAAHEDEHKWYWILFDLINIFQSVAIFAIFVCNTETFAALQAKYPICRKFLSPLMRKSGRNDTTPTGGGVDRRDEEDSGRVSTVDIGTCPTPPKDAIQLS